MATLASASTVTNYASLHEDLVRTIVAARTGATAKQKEFIEAFYALSPVSELEELDAAHAHSVALYCEQFIAKRNAQGPKLVVESFRSVGLGHTRTRLVALNDDMPFLVDSLSALFTSLGLTIHLILHPIFSVTRDARGELKTYQKSQESDDNSTAESLIYVELSPLPMALSQASLLEKVEETLQHVQAAVSDWRAMRDSVVALAAAYAPKDKNDTENKEVQDLLSWLAGNHFVFLGCADYRVCEKASTAALALDTKSALGIYRLPSTEGIERGSLPTATAGIHIYKASEPSRVHRRVHMDYIALRRTDARGNYIGETRMLGLFTSTVYYREIEQIPFIRNKAVRLMKRSGFSAGSHSAKALKTVLEFLPREELFQMDEDALFAMAMRIVALDARPQVRLFVRRDPFERFVSALVYVPREQLSTELREEIMRTLAKAYEGNCVNFNVQVTESPLARVSIEIATKAGAIPEVSVSRLEQQIADLANVWSAALHDAIIDEFGDLHGQKVASSYLRAFPPSYVNTHSASAAAFDIRRMEECANGDGLALELFRRPDMRADELHLKCFTHDLGSELSSIIPLLEHMGATVIDATPYTITPLAPALPVLMRDITLRVSNASSLDLAANKARIESAIASVWRGHTDNDHFNALVFAAGLSVREIGVLRTYSRYLQQLDFPYSQQFIAQALVTHASIARQLVDLFDARFNPTLANNTARAEEIKTAIENALEHITNLAEDRVIRRLLALAEASLRTNFYQKTTEGKPKEYLSIKLRSSLVPDMKLPVPYAEIFVTSMRMEGIHLRGGPVARGGLRWSDRPEDFRTEVLGLVKAQMVKNAVIVPTGAKGGFILRKAPSEREALQKEGIECYQLFLRGLLDITDNIVGGKIVPPADVVRHDGDDPYLVVAADKGTATFSDTANALAASYNFWLGDAFASGGSVGYDHKAMGITAKGGWVAVMRHFRELGKDIEKESFTCAGIGDLSGDVFGNGMLLSRTMKLVAAFNHKHIFIDPSPEPESSFAERERMFKLPRSSWTDYNTALISKGGGIFERSAKSIKLSAEARAVLGTDQTSVTPDELVRIILKSPVDLLWNGGIGTYVKAASESHEQVGDRANNAVRINGRELRCKLVGEGGNLGFTQRGRIEYARNGGRINTDAIDNSAGVDCSDHEVNIKIALGTAVSSGRMTIARRDALLKKMTDEVADLVLIDNTLQTQAISIAELQGASMLEPAEQLMAVLEKDGLLNRDVEFLPDAKQLGELRASKLGLTRPEISVLLAYAKMSLYDDLQDSTLLDAPYFEQDLLRYFPKVMAKDYAEEIRNHRLRRPIVATMITNSIVNRTGFSFAHSLMKATGLSAGDIAQAYVATRDAFRLRELWAEIEALDGKIPAAVQSQLFSQANQFIEHGCRWFLQHVPQPMDMEKTIAKYADAIGQLEKNAPHLMSETLKKAYDKSIESLHGYGVPDALAQRIAKLELLASACDIIDVTATSNRPLDGVGRMYFELGAQLKLGWLRRTAQQLTGENYWQQLAIKSLVIELYQAQARLTQEVIRRYPKADDAAAAWLADIQDANTRYLGLIDQLRTQQSFDYPMLIVALRQVQWITSQ